MRIGVVSDTHGDIQSLKRVIAAAGPVEHWLHAGDYYQDGWRLAELSQLPVTVVAGNCDRAAAVPADEYVELAGKTIWLTHGHRHKVKYGTQDLTFWGRQYCSDIVIFGHTHVTYNRWHDDILLFNPGSPSAPRGETGPTYGILHIRDNGIVEAQIVKL
ncbi:metallophosphoesterase [Sporomusa aerivorans]|uniref:metallophosphoesterase family protein n=1 Tax=Sporomusa aerivorans TaxID=204936 RepID=UPI00352A7881